MTAKMVAKIRIGFKSSPVLSLTSRTNNCPRTSHNHGKQLITPPASWIGVLCHTAPIRVLRCWLYGSHTVKSHKIRGRSSASRSAGYNSEVGIIVKICTPERVVDLTAPRAFLTLVHKVRARTITRIRWWSMAFTDDPNTWVGPTPCDSNKVIQTAGESGIRDKKMLVPTVPRPSVCR